jgi:hypothetical protein
MFISYIIIFEFPPHISPARRRRLLNSALTVLNMAEVQSAALLSTSR